MSPELSTAGLALGSLAALSAAVFLHALYDHYFIAHDEDDSGD